MKFRLYWNQRCLMIRVARSTVFDRRIRFSTMNFSPSVFEQNTSVLAEKYVQFDYLDRAQTTDITPKLPTDRHLLLLSDSFLYMLHFCLGRFFFGSCKNGGNIDLLEK